MMFCKGHLSYTCDFITEYETHRDPHNENWHVHCSLHACSMATNASMSQGKFTRGLGMCILLASVLHVSLHGLHMPYDTLTCTLHVYKPTVQPVASHSLFLDIQVVTLLLGGFTLFANAHALYRPTTRLHSNFSTIFEAHLRVYRFTMGCKRSFRLERNIWMRPI